MKLSRLAHTAAFAGTLVMALLFFAAQPAGQHVTGQGGNNQLAIVSAASYASVLAPDSIAAAFGARLATRTEAAATLPLPTNLAGTTVRVNGQLAPLFFVSPGQVNYLVPTDTSAGTANVIVTAGDNTTSSGTVQVAPVAPAIFTANANGQGVPAAVLLRVAANGQQTFEAIAQFDTASGAFRPQPISFGAAGDRLFLILFLSGIRNAGANTVRVLLGGQALTPDYAGAQGGLAGLDQVNVLLPRELQGRGRVNLALHINGFGAANLVELEIAGAANIAPPQVTGYSALRALAGQLLTINGASFSPQVAENTVRIGGIEARVEAASATQLTIRVPFGGQSGVISVRTPQGEGQGAQTLQLRTSISGVIEDTRRQPLAGVKVRAIGTGIEATTGAEGAFILPDVPPSLAQTVEIDGGTVAGTLSYPRLLLKIRVAANRDNQIAAPVSVQQINGPAIPVGGSSFAPTLGGLALRLAAPQTLNQTGRTGNVVFEVQPGAMATFPDGATRGTLNLTIVENSRTPVALPPNIFSTVIAQITAIGVTLNPGGKLTFPNTDNLPANTTATLYRFDQRPESPTLGNFVTSGTVTVSSDGQRLETPLGAISETTLYFVAAPRLATTVIGRVVDSDGLTPVRQVRARARGQEGFTDGNGGFVLRNVLVNANDQLSVEASFQRPNGRVDRVQRGNIPAVANGITTVDALALPAESSNRPPVMLVPSSLTISEGETRGINFVASDPDAGQTVIDVRVSGARFATLVKGGNDLYTLRLAPVANDAGTYTLILTATDNLGASLTQTIAMTVGRLPMANAQVVTTDEDKPVSITLAGSDPGGQTLNYLIVTNPARGSLSGAPPNLTYTPAANYNGTDLFTFRVNNGFTDSAAAVVSIIINPVNDPPVLTVPGPQTVNTGQRLSFTITASDPDADQTLTFSATGLPASASLTTIAPTRAQFTWTPSFAQAGVAQVSFRVTDNGTPPLSDTKPVRVTVVGSWAQTAGPEGGTINALLSTGTSLFAGTEGGGIFRSNDSGTSWTAVNDGLATMFVYAFAANGNVVLAGTNLGVFRSTDNGANWLAANTGLPSSIRIKAFAVSGTSVFACQDGSVYRSTDNGQSWGAASQGLPRSAVFNAFAVSGGSLYLATNSGVYLSTNQGQNWTGVNNGLMNTNVVALAVSGTNLFAGTGITATRAPGGVFLSTNNGQSWVSVSTGLQGHTVQALAVIGTKLLAATEGGGVFLTTSNGQIWTAVNAGLSHLRVRALATSGEDLFAGTDRGGVYFSPNSGQNWASANLGLAATRVLSLAVSGSNLFAGTDGNGVHFSSDNGQTWMAVNAGLPVDTPINALAVLGNNLIAGTNGGVFLSTDNGGTWTASLNGVAILSLTASGTTLFAGTEANGVFRSSDNGSSWSAARSGLPFRFMSTLYLPIQALTASSTSLFAGTSRNRDGGIYRSVNQGTNWTAVNSGLPDTNTLGIYIPPGINTLTANGPNVFAGTGEYGIFRSANNGGSWTMVNSGLPANVTVNALVMNDTTLFAGTAINGVFLSTNNGASWTAVNSGLTNLRILSLTASGTTLLVGTSGSGVFIAQ